MSDLIKAKISTIGLVYYWLVIKLGVFHREYMTRKKNNNLNHFLPTGPYSKKFWPLIPLQIKSSLRSWFKEIKH